MAWSNQQLTKFNQQDFYIQGFISLRVNVLCIKHANSDLSHIHATIHLNGFTCYICCASAYQEANCRGNFLWLTQTVRRNIFKNRFALFIAQRFCHISINKSWRNHVNRDATRSNFACQRLRKADYTRFCSSVVCLTSVTRTTYYRSDRHNATETLLHHSTQNGF